MKTSECIQKSEQYLLHTYNRAPVVWERGEGVRLYDADGKEYLDFAAGIAVYALGYGNPAYREALKDQIDKIIHTSNLYYNVPQAEAAEKLVKASGMSKVFFTNSGTEAIEGAIKAARKYAYLRDGSTDHEIIAMRQSFHGRSLGALSVTGNDHYQEPFKPLIGGIRFADFNDLDSVKAQVTDKTCAIILETVQGEGGIFPGTREFLEGIRKLCDERDILMILDEIQCGMGRTGTLFAHWHDQIVPDIVTLAKALGGGFPIGAMLAGPKVAEAMQFGAHGSTFGGNPLAAAVARVALRKLASREVAGNVSRQSAALRAGLEAINQDLGLFSQIRGRGLMLGAQLGPAHAGRAGEVLDRAAAHGLLMLQAGPDVLRFVPALTINDAEVAEGLARLRQALSALA